MQQFERLPYPNFVNIYINSDWHGYANYNAMNVKLEHRANDLALTAAYTWAHSLDDKSAAAGVGATGAGFQGFMDNHRPQLDYGSSDFNVNQRLVASYVYYLPFGRGKKFANGVNRATDLVIGGWQTTGIATFQSGFPFSITANDIGGALGTFFQRANLVPNCNIHQNLNKTLQRINFNCFTQPPLGEYGDTSRNWLRQPGINNWDLGIAKAFPIHERVQFRIAGDFFNAFNHHQYAISTGALIGSGSGGGSAIDNAVGDTTAGQITSASNPRVVQISGKLTF
jgi:hypothetical protein